MGGNELLMTGRDRVVDEVSVLTPHPPRRAQATKGPPAIGAHELVTLLAALDGPPHRTCEELTRVAYLLNVSPVSSETPTPTSEA